jgi:hypothetical protein
MGGPPLVVGVLSLGGCEYVQRWEKFGVVVVCRGFACQGQNRKEDTGVRQAWGILGALSFLRYAHYYQGEIGACK